MLLYFWIKLWVFYLDQFESRPCIHQNLKKYSNLVFQVPRFLCLFSWSFYRLPLPFLFVWTLNGTFLSWPCICSCQRFSTWLVWWKIGKLITAKSLGELMQKRGWFVKSHSSNWCYEFCNPGACEVINVISFFFFVGELWMLALFWTRYCPAIFSRLLAGWLVLLLLLRKDSCTNENNLLYVFQVDLQSWNKKKCSHQFKISAWKKSSLVMLLVFIVFLSFPFSCWGEGKGTQVTALRLKLLFLVAEEAADSFRGKKSMQLPDESLDWFFFAVESIDRWRNILMPDHEPAGLDPAHSSALLCSWKINK